MLGPIGVAPKPTKARQAKAAGVKAQTRESMLAAAGEADRPDEVQEVENAANSHNTRRANALWNLLSDKSLIEDEASTVVCADGQPRRLLPLVPFIFDPYSYSQTVENLFYMSALVKEGRAGVYMAPPPGGKGGKGGAATAAAATAPAAAVPWMRVIDVEESKAIANQGRAEVRGVGGGGGGGGGGRADLTQQLIVHIDPSSWRRIVAAFGLKTPRLPHRHTRDSTAPPGYAYAVDEEDAPAPAAAASGKKRGRDAAGGNPPASARATAATARRRGAGTSAREHDDDEEEEEDDGGGGGGGGSE